MLKARCCRGEFKPKVNGLCSLLWDSEGFLLLAGMGCYRGRSKAIGVPKIVSQYCTSTKALVPETQVLAGLCITLLTHLGNKGNIRLDPTR